MEEIRRENSNDSAGLARVQVNSCLGTYSGIFPSKYLELSFGVRPEE
jgi:hypothetical protein